MQFLFRIKAENEMDPQLESNEKINSEEISTQNVETPNDTDDIPPSCSKIYLISEN